MIVTVPLLVQFAMVDTAVTVIVFPAQGSTGVGFGEGLSLEQDTKLADINIAAIEKNIIEIFFDIKVVLNGIGISYSMVALKK